MYEGSRRAELPDGPVSAIVALLRVPWMAKSSEKMARRRPSTRQHPIGRALTSVGACPVQIPTTLNTRMSRNERPDWNGSQLVKRHCAYRGGTTKRARDLTVPRKCGHPPPDSLRPHVCRCAVEQYRTGVARAQMVVERAGVERDPPAVISGPPRLAPCHRTARRPVRVAERARAAWVSYR